MENWKCIDASVNLSLKACTGTGDIQNIPVIHTQDSKLFPSIAVLFEVHEGKRLLGCLNNVGFNSIFRQEWINATRELCWYV